MKNKTVNMKPIDKILEAFDEGIIEMQVGAKVDPRVLDEHKVREFISHALKSYAKDMLDDILPEEKNTANGDGLPFENSPEIYGNRRIVAYGNGFNECRQQIKDKAKHWIE